VKKLSLTLKISLLVSGLIVALLVTAGLFISSFSSVIKSSQQDADLRLFETEFIAHWDELKVHYGLARELGPKFFAKDISQEDLEAAIELGKSLESELAEHLEELDPSIGDSWNAANAADLDADLDTFLARYNDHFSTLQVAFDDAATAWITKASWNQRNGVDKALQAAIIPLDESIKEFSSRYGALFKLRSEKLVNGQKATIRMLSISLIFLVGVVVFISIAVLRKLKTDLQSIVYITNQLANGDLSTQVESKENGDEVDEVKNAVSAMNEKLRSIVESVVELSEHLKQSAQGILTDTESRFKDAETQNEKLLQLTHSIGQMSEFSGQVSNAATESLTVAGQADESATNGSQTVTETIDAINTLAKEIEESVSVIEKLDGQAENITTIITSIQAIAEQTNLLALNAAIEAARAGEQGRGFAVVADEVRNLAHRTQESTEEIQKTLEELRQGTQAAVGVIGGSHKKSVSTVEKVTEAGDAISQFNAAVSTIKDWTMQTSDAAENQNVTLDELTLIVDAVKVITEENTQRAKDSLSSTEMLSDLSEDLISSISFFRLK